MIVNRNIKRNQTHLRIVDLLTLIANSKVSSTKIKESSDVTFKRVATPSIILD